MTSKVYIVTDLGPGDGGKGGVVHAVAKSQRAHTIIKRGGAQGSHGVRTHAGKEFAFSQWGCGTFEGILTHLTEQMIVSPTGLWAEAGSLQNECGVYDPFEMLTIDERACVATPFHTIASRLFELARGTNPRGTIGSGCGQAYRDFKRYPEFALRVGDLRANDLYARLRAIRDNVRGYVYPVMQDADILPGDTADVRYLLGELRSDAQLDEVYEKYLTVAEYAKIVAPDYLGEVILQRPGTAVIETSHGVLTDRMYGFSPHTSAIRTLPSFTRQILDDAGYGGKVVNLGVTRAYAIRHGAGPLPTHDPTLSEHLLPGSHKDDNRYQGKVRVGAFDGMLLRYAINVCGGPSAFDGLAITWFDQIRENGEWLTCDAYQKRDDATVFTREGELRVIPNTTDELQARYTAALQDPGPIVDCQPIDPTLSNDSSIRCLRKQGERDDRRPGPHGFHRADRASKAVQVTPTHQKKR
jgi:adenylosuccinate synthase